MARDLGIPNVTTYGGFTEGGTWRWMSGYDKYYEAMQNRVSDYYSISINTAEGMNTLKQWFYDRGNGSSYGGVAVFSANSSGNLVTGNQPEDGTPEAGAKIYARFGTGGFHAMTFTGYNDSIRYDFNGDGQYTNDIDITGDGVVDMKDWEIGALRLTNSWGGWQDSGRVWVPYATIARYTHSGDVNAEYGGIYQGKVYVANVHTAYTPKYTLKFTVTSDDRNKVLLTAGVSGDMSATAPEFSTGHKGFRYTGPDSIPMQGKDSSSTLEGGFDVTPLVENLEAGSPMKFFLTVGGKNESAGVVKSASIIDYTGAVVAEYHGLGEPFRIDNGTYHLPITFEAPAITLFEPQAGDLFTRGDSIPIKWSYAANDPVSLYLVNGSGVRTAIAENTTETDLNWAIQQTFPVGTEYRILAISSADTTVQTLSEMFTTESIYETFEAESATVNGGLFNDGKSGFTGTGYIDFQNTSGDYIEWEIPVAEDGFYQLSFRFALDGGNRALSISVDGNEVHSSLDFPSTGGWTSWHYTEKIDVELTAGTHTIRAATNGKNGANVDHLKLNILGYIVTELQYDTTKVLTYDTVTVSDSVVQSNLDTIVTSVATEYSSGVIIIDTDSLENGFIVFQKSDTASISDTIIISTTYDTLSYQPAITVTVDSQSVSDTITVVSVDSSILSNMDTVVTTVTTQNIYDTVIITLDSLADGKSFFHDVDTIVDFTSIVLDSTVDTLFVEDPVALTDQKALVNRVNFSANPVNRNDNSVTLQLPDGSGEYQLLIFDALGNKLCERNGTLSEAKVIWNLATQSGRRVGSGSYLVIMKVIESAGKNATYKSLLGVKE